MNHFPWYQYNVMNRDQFIHLYKGLCFIYILKAVLRCPSGDAQPFNYQHSRNMYDTKSQRTKHKSWVPGRPQAVRVLGDCSALLWNFVSPKPVWYGSTSPYSVSMNLLVPLGLRAGLSCTFYLAKCIWILGCVDIHVLEWRRKEDSCRYV